MKLTVLYLESIPWTKITAFAIVIFFCTLAFYKEDFLVGKSENDYYNGLKEKSKTKLSGRIITALIGGVFVVLSLLIAYIFYQNN